MSRFLSEEAAKLAPYTPGEQPQDKKYIKLNTNESPFSPSLMAARTLATFPADSLRLYPDPDSSALKAAVAGAYGLDVGEVFAGNGSDEVLAFAFMAFFARGDNTYFPDITYGFYKVYADLFGVAACELPLCEDYTINVFDYFNRDGNIILANPNAPTGICLKPEDIEEILRRNPDRLVVVDEAYIDFAPGKTCIPLIRRYDNLLIVQTFSKSRALAGLRVGFAFGNPELIAGLERIRYSFNPYNLDQLASAVAIAAVEDRACLEQVTREIISIREKSRTRLESLGFEVLASEANFLLARTPAMPGYDLYRTLKERGILVRHFDRPRIRDFVRITIGTQREMDALISALTELCSGEAKA